jgi:hypothetical protein
MRLATDLLLRSPCLRSPAFALARMNLVVREVVLLRRRETLAKRSATLKDRKLARGLVTTNHFSTFPEDYRVLFGRKCNRRPK